MPAKGALSFTCTEKYMIYATKQNTKVGDTVLIPIEGEWMSDEQIMLEHEVVMAFKCKVPAHKQIVGTGLNPLPELTEFHDDIALKGHVV